MTSRERLLAVLNREIPDCVPASPDTSNMIPCRLTGRPFWDIYLFNEIPLWKAYINCVKHFGYDAFFDGLGLSFDELGEIDHDTFEAIIHRNDDRIITRYYKKANGKLFWNDRCSVYHRADPPSMHMKISNLKLPEEPGSFTDVIRKESPAGAELMKAARAEMGDHGVIGVFSGTSMLISCEDEIYDYADNPEKYFERREQLLEYYEKRFRHIMSLEVRPDFIATGGSGSLIFQTPETFRELALPIVKKVTALCKEFSIPSHIHSCGPEAELVKICAEETDLTIIDPLEIPPMGNCNLKELKELYGDKLVLKGNLHTTNVMLQGTPEQVREASRQAIDDAAEGGGFMLSTGDQCGRDTPDENMHAMIETARTYGRYNNDGSLVR